MMRLKRKEYTREDREKRLSLFSVLEGLGVGGLAAKDVANSQSLPYFHSFIHHFDHLALPYRKASQ